MLSLNINFQINIFLHFSVFLSVEICHTDIHMRISVKYDTKTLIDTVLDIMYARYSLLNFMNFTIFFNQHMTRRSRNISGHNLNFETVTFRY